jgi:hypothetical protein
MKTLADMKAAVALGDAARANSQWGTAVMHYQAAGMMGATDVGSAIDTMSKGATAGITQRAWDTNGLLANINSTGDATEDNAAQAWNFITQMMGQYVAANALATKPAAHADYKPPPLVVTSNILPPGATAMPPLGQALQPVKPPPPPPVSAAPARAAPPPVYVAPQPPVASTAMRLPVVKPPPVSGKNALAAAALGAGGWFVGGPVGAVVGAVLGAAGSKFILKW